MTARREEQRVREAVRRHERSSAFAEAERVISAVLSDPQVQQVRARIEAAETEPGAGAELNTHLQPAHDHSKYDKLAVRHEATVLVAAINERL